MWRQQTTSTLNDTARLIATAFRPLIARPPSRAADAVTGRPGNATNSLPSPLYSQPLGRPTPDRTLIKALMPRKALPTLLRCGSHVSSLLVLRFCTRPA